MKAKKRTPRPAKKLRPIISKEEIAANKRDIKYIAIHCAASSPSMKVDRERIKGWHISRGFSDIGYHFVILRSGVIEMGRDLDGDGLVLEEVGAHVAGINSKSIGICWCGGVMESDKKTPEDNRTPEQLESMERLIKELHAIYPDAIIQGHRDFKGVAKSCPSFEVSEWLTEIGI